MSDLLAPQLIKNGRYQIITPDGKKAVGYTRATNIAKALENNHNLEKWKVRTSARGLAARADLLALVSSAPDDDHKVDQACEDAILVAKGDAGRNSGSALHSFTEQVDHGEKIAPPEPYDKDVEAYRCTLEAAGITILADYIERVVVHDTLKIAGTFDRIVRLADGRNVIADLKTGGFLPWQSIAIQLSIYANAEHLYTPATGFRSELPELDPTVGLVIHLPVGTATCTLHTVDLVQGWEACELALQVRQWRNAKVAAPYTHDADRPAPLNKRAALISRVEAIRDHGNGAIELLAANWPPHIPTLKASDAHTYGQLEELAVAVSHVEAEAGVTF